MLAAIWLTASARRVSSSSGPRLRTRREKSPEAIASTTSTSSGKPTSSRRAKKSPRINCSAAISRPSAARSGLRRISAPSRRQREAHAIHAAGSSSNASVSRAASHGSTARSASRKPM